MLPCRLGGEWSHSETFPWSDSNSSISLVQYWEACWLKEWQLRKGWGAGPEKGGEVSWIWLWYLEGKGCLLCHSLDEKDRQWCQGELICFGVTWRSLCLLQPYLFRVGFSALRRCSFSKTGLFGELHLALWVWKAAWMVTNLLIGGGNALSDLLDAWRNWGTESKWCNHGTNWVWVSEMRGGWQGGDVYSWNSIKPPKLLIPNSRFLPQKCHMLHQLKVLNIGGQW